MDRHYSFNAFHLGDNLAHLHFLRKLAMANPQHQFIHFVHECHMAQLAPVVEDIPTIELLNIESKQGRKAADGQLVDADNTLRARNVWKNAGGYWENHQFRNDYTNFYIRWFQKLAAEMGLLSPIMHPANMLFDYPKLLEPAWPADQFDYLVINSRPCSGQFMAYNHVNYFDPLLRKLVAAGKTVAATQETSVDGVCCTTQASPAAIRHPLTLTQIGNLSMRCKNIIAVATGPLWPCVNVWSNPEKLIICLDCGEQNIAPGAVYCRSIAEVEKELGL